ncbi:MAG: hypothetical protein MUC79_04080 [Thiobacillaceae bacterium]|jgi:hypothetical protein|nr:hypothetical protein [Thiobacillaceae bacterium]
MDTEARYRIPPGVAFQRWSEGGSHGADEWVVYHDGTGQTLRLSEAALAVLDALLEGGPQDRATIALALAGLLDAPAGPEELDTALDHLLRGLLEHECIEALPCD